jgi:DNA-binding NtrC family response regulator
MDQSLFGTLSEIKMTNTVKNGKTSHIIIADDEVEYHRLLIHRLGNHPYKVTAVNNGLEVLKKFDNTVSLILLDLHMPIKDGLSTLRDLRAINAEIPIIMLTADDNLDVAVECLKNGATDYFLKSFPLDRLILMMDNNIHRYERKKNEVLGQSYFKNLIGECPSMKKLKKTLESLKEGTTPVLILGDSGVGKELVAKILHQTSIYHNGKFVDINMSAIPETLFESEFFGYEKGAFTGASGSKTGFFELAHNGTLFLDEIGSLTMAMQTKVLRVLEESSFFRLGGKTKQVFNARLVSATNANLPAAIESGEFRNDLYYRLARFVIRIPALKERREDIPLLVDHFLNTFVPRANQEKLRISPKALRLLKAYSWPGNVRELQNAIYQASIALGSKSLIEPIHLPSEIQNEGINPADFGELKNLPPSLRRAFFYREVVPFKEMEREILSQMVSNAGGNLSVAAKSLGMGRNTLYRKKKEYKF